MTAMLWIAPDRIAASLDAGHAGPTPEDLADAPRLTAWRIVIEPGERVVRLHGRVTGHPEIDDPELTTSAVIALDAGGSGGDHGVEGWARTLSRWYRLDGASFRPADPAARDAELATLGRALAGYRRHLAAALESHEADVYAEPGAEQP